MPTILREGPYRFYFVSADGVEPPHIHVKEANNFAKFWLIPVRLQDGGRFSNKELRDVQRIIERNKDKFTETWNDYFNV